MVKVSLFHAVFDVYVCTQWAIKIEDGVHERGRGRIRGQEDDQGETSEVQKPKKPILTFKMDR